MYITASQIANYNPSSFLPQNWREWDTYSHRLSRYEVLEGYYHNVAYHEIVTYSQALKTLERLYKHVRGVYNPTKRLVDSYVSKIYGGVLDTKRGEAGSIPLDTENDRLREAIATRLWVDSQWGQKKSLYVRYGARSGDAFIKVVDDLDRGQVRMEVVDPKKVKVIEKDASGQVIYAEIEYYVRRNGEMVLYCETITPESFKAYVVRTETIGELTRQIKEPVYTNERNDLVMEWDNDYGFVPLQHTLHTDEGLLYGAPAIHGMLHKINEINDIASILNDGMRRQVNLPLVAINARVGSLDFGSDQSTNQYDSSDKPKKDTMNVLNIVGDNADLRPLPPTINIQDGLTNIKEILAEIERDSPELSLHRIRESGNVTAPGTRSAYDDAIAKYQEARGNYDTNTVQAQKMAVYIGAMRGYNGYEGLRASDLYDAILDHQISERPVISDTLSMGERQDYILRGQQQNMPKTYYLGLGLTDAEADEYVNSGQSARDSFMMTNPFETATTTPPVDDPDATPEDVFESRLNSAVNETDILNANELLAEAV